MYCSANLRLWQTRSHPEMVSDMSRVTLNFDLSEIPFGHFQPGSRPILTPKIRHVHLLVLIWERLQTTTTTTTTTTPTTPHATVQPLGRHIAKYSANPDIQRWLGRLYRCVLRSSVGGYAFLFTERKCGTVSYVVTSASSLYQFSSTNRKLTYSTAAVTFSYISYRLDYHVPPLSNGGPCNSFTVTV